MLLADCLLGVLLRMGVDFALQDPARDGRPFFGRKDLGLGLEPSARFSLGPACGSLPTAGPERAAARNGVGSKSKSEVPQELEGWECI